MKKNAHISHFPSKKGVATVSLCAVLIALSCILAFFKWAITPNVNITFFFLPTAVAALILGPFPAALVGGISDVLGAIIAPTGPYFPGFTINMIIVGIVYGLFFKSKKPMLWKVIAARLIVMVLVDLILTPIWLNILYSVPLVLAFWVERFIKCAIVCPIEIAIIFTVNSALYRLKNRL